MGTTSPDTTPPHQESPRAAVFVTTRWSVVLSAGKHASPQAADALENLCRAYWFPLYAHVRRCGHSPSDAQDLTQAFFARLLEKNWLADANRERGRFRSFLLASLKHFLANEWDKAQAQKRGGQVRLIALQADTAETRYLHDPADDDTPNKAFDRRWALAVLDRVLALLREEYVGSGRGELYEQLRATLEGVRTAAPYAAIAKQLGLTEGAVKVAVHRFRQRYREILREEIAQTVETPAQVEEELHHLFAALAR
jgi:RNA polymerase sigma-70 factor (ECF subfamily)